MWVQDCYREDIPKDSNMIQEKAKSLYDNLRQMEGEDFNASKEWFDNFKTRSGFKKCKDNRKRNKICQRK